MHVFKACVPEVSGHFASHPFCPLSVTILFHSNLFFDLLFKHSEKRFGKYLSNRQFSKRCNIKIEGVIL